MSDIKNVELRNLNIQDYEELKSAMMKAYEKWPESYWREHEIRTLLNIFPMGQIGVLVDGVIVGCALSIIVKYELYSDEHSYKDITGNYTFRPTTPRAMCCTASTCLSSPTTGGCDWDGDFTMHARNCASSSTSRPLYLGDACPATTKWRPSSRPKNTCKKSRTRRFTILR